MFDTILPYMCCTRCGAARLQDGSASVTCLSCGTAYQVRDGILDFLGDDSSEVITPFQRVMQTRVVVTIYERMWRRAGYYLASSRSFSREIETVLRLQRSWSGSPVLDLACGTGVFTRPLAKQCSGIVVGLDLSWPMLRYARRMTRVDRLENILLLRASAFHLPFLPESLACVNCCGALHLFDRPDEALAEIERVLRPNGSLCVQTTIRPEHSAGMAYFLERFIRFGFFREAKLRETIRAHGLRISESERHRISFTFLARKEGLVQTREKT